MTDRERDATLGRIEGQLKDIREALDRDFKALYGNGHKGLLARMAAVETWIREHSESWKWVLSTIIAVAAICHDAILKELAERNGGSILALPTICMYTHDSTGRKAILTGWLASQSDMLLEDWEEAPEQAEN